MKNMPMRASVPLKVGLIRRLPYSKFLDDSPSQSSKFIRIFEEESFDVSKVFSTLKDFCSFYVNWIRSFDSMRVSLENIMKSIKDKTFEDNYLISDHDYESEFLLNFNFDLDILERETIDSLLQKTKNYYLAVLRKFNEHFVFEDSIFKYLEILNLSNKKYRNLEPWKKLFSRFPFF